MTTYLTIQTWNDAGLFREYLHDRGIGGTLLHGGLNGQLQRAHRLVRHLARLAGMTYDEARQQTIDDYRHSDVWN